MILFMLGLSPSIWDISKSLEGVSTQKPLGHQTPYGPIKEKVLFLTHDVERGGW